jgi:hypothetical protein
MMWGDALDGKNASKIPWELREEVEGMAKLMAELASLRGPQPFAAMRGKAYPRRRLFKKKLRGRRFYHRV